MLKLKPHSIDRSVAGAEIPANNFIPHGDLPIRELAHVLDSLVRVSRRVERNHFANVGLRVSSSKHIRTPDGEQPCAWSLPHPRTHIDKLSEKHHERNGQSSLRCSRSCSEPSRLRMTISPSYAGPSRFTFSNFRHF